MSALARPPVRVLAWGLAVAIFCGGIALRLNNGVTETDAYQQRVNTSLLNFDVTWIKRPASDRQALGGGLGLHPAGIFVARKEDGGEVHFLPAGKTELLSVGLRLPVGNRAAIPETTPGGRSVHRHLLRQNDIAIFERNGIEYLLVSYSAYREQEGCFVGRLASIPLPEGWVETVNMGEPPPFSQWSTVFETAPCLPLVEGAAFPFTGHQAGGQITVAPDNAVYLSIGDYGFDGLEGKLPPHPQLENSSYGRILKFTPVEEGPWPVETIAIGLRNPQGLDIDDQGRLWETEHAAMGGDELNLIREGANYGWPVVTLGVNYVEDDSDAKYWPFSPDHGQHPGYVPPVYAWVPSIAPANVRFVEGLSPRWDGSLLVGALKQESIVRLQLEGSRVVLAEHIPMGRRVRYVEIGHGRLYVLFDIGDLAILTPRAMTSEFVDIATVMDEVYDPAAPGAVTVVGSGSMLSSLGCMQCHSGAGAPTLRGLLGRPIAAQSGVEYSSALAAKGGVWDAASIRSFLASPQTFAPGTTMPPPTLSAREIDQVIEALQVRTEY